jgi:hypothetical protein
MGLIRTTVAIRGFTPAEATQGAPDLRTELTARTLLGEVRWDEETRRLFVTVESRDLGPRTVAFHQDQIWDCVIACVQFSGKGICLELVKG